MSLGYSRGLSATERPQPDVLMQIKSVGQCLVARHELEIAEEMGDWIAQ